MEAYYINVKDGEGQAYITKHTYTFDNDTREEFFFKNSLMKWKKSARKLI